jgi:hypothetical protein
MCEGAGEGSTIGRYQIRHLVTPFGCVLRSAQRRDSYCPISRLNNLRYCGADNQNAAANDSVVATGAPTKINASEGAFGPARA